MQFSNGDLWRLLLVILLTIFSGRTIVGVAGQEWDTSYDTHNFIIGAEEEYIGHWPSQVSLQIYGKHRCGAVLLSESFVLTAAHCVSDKELPYHVVLGKHDLEKNTIGQKRKVRSIHIHPSYWPLRNDISVLELEEPAEFHENAKPAFLAGSLDNFTGTECYITGWGMTDGRTQELPSALKEVNIQVISLTQCKDLLQDDSCCPVSESNVCVYDPDHIKAACTGDSGGPLFCRYSDQHEWHVVGVTSYVIREQYDTSHCSAKYPSVYTSVSYFGDWIREIMTARTTSTNRVTDFTAKTKSVTSKVTDSTNNDATDAKSEVTDVTILETGFHSTTISSIYNDITKVSVTDSEIRAKSKNDENPDTDRVSQGYEHVTLTFDKTSKNNDVPYVESGVRSNNLKHGGFYLSPALSNSWTVTFTHLHTICIIFFTFHTI